MVEIAMFNVQRAITPKVGKPELQIMCFANHLIVLYICVRFWKRPLLPSGQLSKPGRLVKALGHHMMQPNEMPDMQCTMLVKRPTRRSTRILTPSLQKPTALLPSLKERTLMLLVTNL